MCTLGARMQRLDETYDDYIRKPCSNSYLMGTTASTYTAPCAWFREAAVHDTYTFSSVSAPSAPTLVKGREAHPPEHERTTREGRHTYETVKQHMIRSTNLCRRLTMHSGSTREQVAPHTALVGPAQK